MSSDTGTVPTRVTSSRFIGRSRELAELEAALADASAGRPSLAFIAGESGVGKTRLLQELERGALAAEARVVSGECVALGDDELPYAPIVAALRSLTRDGDPVLDELGPATRAGLASLLPELAPATALPVMDRDAPAQSRVFEALLTLLDQLGRDEPVLLAIEDLHWADASTRAFLSFLARSLRAERVMVVASYRPDELHRRHPLRPLLAELERGPRARRIELVPLTRTELAQQLEDILGATPDVARVARMYARSEGNPLFTEELLAAGLDGRGELPPTLRDALMVRIEALPQDAQELLRVLSAGRSLDHTLLAGCADRSPQKWGRRTPRTGIPIMSEQAARLKADYFLVLPWHFRDEFVQREAEFLARGGKLIFPLPEFELVGAQQADPGHEKVVASGRAAPRGF